METEEAQTYGGLDVKLLDSYTEFECPVCQLTLRDPVQIVGCGHRICSSCLQEMKKSSKNLVCPLDRKELKPDMIFLDKGAQRQIQALRVSCQSIGCDWTGELMLAEDHLKKCAYVKVNCPNKSCPDSLLQNELNQHLELHCNYRNVECSYCHEKCIYNNLQNHQEICNNFPLECSNNCGLKDILRSEMTFHVENECPHTVGPCEYFNIGCLFKGMKKERDFHMISSMNDHLSLAISKVSCGDIMRSRIEKQLSDIENQNNALREKVERLEIDAISMKERTSYMESSMEKDGCREFIWLIRDFHSIFKKTQTATDSEKLHSNYFFSGKYGYKMRLIVYMNGCGKATGNHLSLYFQLIKGEYDNLLEWPFSKKVTLSVLDQSEKKQHWACSFLPSKSSNAFDKPVLNENCDWGFTSFMPHEKLTENGYITNNTLFIKCEVHS